MIQLQEDTDFRHIPARLWERAGVVAWDVPEPTVEYIVPTFERGREGEREGGREKEGGGE